MLIKDKRITVFDLGSQNIKMLMGKIKDKVIHIENYEIFPTPKNTIKDGKIMDKESITSFLSKIKIKGKDIRIVLSSDEIVLRNFDFPKMDKDELLDAIKFEMSILLPENVEQYSIDCYIMDEYTKINDQKEVTMVKVQGVAILNHVVEDYVQCFLKAGYKINMVDIQSNCLNKLFCSDEGYIQKQGEVPLAQRNIAIIDFGHEKTSLTFVENKQVFLHRVLNGGASNITNILANTLKLDLEEAEKWKQEIDFSFLKSDSMTEIESRLADDINKNFHDITLEIYQVIEFFISMSTKKKLDDIFLIGGGILIMPHIHEFIEHYANIKPQFVHTLHKIQSAPIPQKDMSIIMNSLGAFIRRG
ncbi:MAG: pilus assembly protein PilM [Eubacteriales bacterium]